MEKSLIVSLFPALTLVGGLFLGKNVSLQYETYEVIEQFIAGVLLATISVEIIPEIEIKKDLQHRLSVILGLIIGGYFMTMAKYTTHTQEISENRNIMISVIINSFFDGLIAGTLAQTFIGYKSYIVAILLSIDNVLLGIRLYKETKSTRSLIIYGILCPLLVLFGGVLGGYLVLNYKNTPLEYGVIAVSISSLLWIITTELIPIAKFDHKIIYSVMLYSGFIFVTIINWLM